ncbi:hypothetical protein O181_023982 [Austropuccinia psidii MF-1]|uniref:Uncharacterized protein n=1 Tax=Austropuccinia psidii MF-1 TaxID=1389203 RepID=A0A9Q3CID4_9BASI|nr:hypothetical protein [Austropuccinia psidii MF-1]
MANCTLLVLYGLLAITRFRWPYPAFIGQFPTSPTSRPLSLFLGLGGPFNLLGAYGPSSHLQGSWPNPFYHGALGLNGPWYVGHLGPKFHSTQNGHKRPSGPKMAKTLWTPFFSPWPLVITRGRQLSSQKVFSFLNALRTHGSTSGAYMVIPNKVPSPSPIFKGGLFSYSVWKFPGGYQKTIQGPQPPGPAGVGLSILTRTIPRAILRGNQSYSIIFKASSTHHSLDNSIGPYR